MKYSKDGLVRFDPATHTYYLGEKKLPGVTGIISRYKTPFDQDAQAEKYALKHGMLKEDILRAWKAKADAAINEGNTVHKHLEDFAKEGVLFEPKTHKQQHAMNFIQDFYLTGRMKIVEAEMLVHNGCIASQIDKVVENELGKRYILDYKTNDEIKRDSWGRFMQAPFETLPDCTYVHYSMQTSIYEHLCTEYDINGSYIVHINNFGYELIKPEKIHIPQHILRNEPKDN